MRDNPAPSRSVGIDVVRVVAIVAGHAWTRDRSAVAVYPWHVPVFFILSGYLWSGRRSLRQETRRRLETLGRPYVFWLVALIAPTLVVLGPEAKDRIGGALRGGAAALQPFTTFWFVSALLVTALLFAALQRLPSWLRWVLTGLGAVLGWSAGELLAGTPWSVGMALACAIYLQVGWWFRQTRPRLTRPGVWGLAALVAGFVLVVMSWARPPDLKVGDFGTPVLSLAASILISAGLILCAEAFAVRLPEAAAVWVTRCAMAGLTVVLVHPLFLWAPRPWLAFVLGLLVPGVIGLVALRTSIAP